MQEHVAPPLVAPTTEGSLADLPARNAERHPDNIAFSRKEGGRWVDVTAREFEADVRAVAKGLVAAGVAPGDRVAIMCKTRCCRTGSMRPVAGSVTAARYMRARASTMAYVSCGHSLWM